MRFTSLAGNKTSPSVRVCLAAVVAVGLMSCDARTDEPQRLTTYKPRLPVDIWTDPETNCQYFWNDVYSGNVLTPRLNRDGKPMCGTP